MTLLPWNWLKMRVSAKKTVMVINILQMICVGHVLESPRPYQQTLFWKLEWKTAARFYNHSVGMKSYLLKNNFKRSLQKHHFVYVYEVVVKYYLNFITCLYFPRPLIRWNSSHCHLMELFNQILGGEGGLKNYHILGGWGGLHSPPQLFLKKANAIIF